MRKDQLALLLVDIQNDFWKSLQEEPAFATFPTNIRSLLATARAHGLLVVHTQAIFRADGSDWMLFYRPEARGMPPCLEGTAGAIFSNFALPHEGEPVLQKQTFDGFLHTELEGLLRQRGIQALLIAGLETSVCVLFTATAAYLRRFLPLVVADACADSQARHETTLRLYNNLCFHTVTTAQVQADLAGILQQAAPLLDDSTP